MKISTRRAGRRVALLAVMTLASLAGCGDGGTGTGGAASTGQASGPHPGEETYNRYCFSCHASGIADAPKTGDAEAWAPRIAKGDDLLLKATRVGVPPGMPAMGLCISCSDDELAAAIDYMISASR